MINGVCIESDATTSLREGQKYFLFDHGPNNFYVSKFNNVNAHFGSYQRKRFEIIEQKPQELEGMYYARVSKPRLGYRIGDEFIIGPARKHKQYFNVYLKDRPHKGPVGSYINNFFELIGPYEEPKKEVAAQAPEMAQIEPIEPPGTNTLPTVKTAENEPEETPQIKIVAVSIKKEKPKKKKLTKYEKLEAEGQLNLFDF